MSESRRSTVVVERRSRKKTAEVKTSITGLENRKRRSEMITRVEWR